MYAYDIYEGNTADPENNISQKEIFLEVDDYSVGADIIEESEGREYE